MTDKQLVALCIQGDRKAQKELYDTYSGQMYSICLRYCSDKGIAADAMQNGFIRVFKYMDKFQETGHLGAWIRRIIVNSCLDQLKKRGKNLTVEIDKVDLKKHRVEIQPISDSFNMDRIMNLLKKLPLGYRTIFSMSVFDEMNHKEIAAALKITESTSRSQFMRARKMLQEQIKMDAYLSSQYLTKKKTFTA